MIEDCCLDEDDLLQQQQQQQQQEVDEIEAFAHLPRRASEWKEGAMATEGLGFLGLGIMGVAMAKNLLKLGVPVCVWNRSPEKVRIWKAE